MGRGSQLARFLKALSAAQQHTPRQCSAGWDEGLAAVHDGQVVDEDDVALLHKIENRNTVVIEVKIMPCAT